MHAILKAVSTNMHIYVHIAVWAVLLSMCDCIGANRSIAPESNTSILNSTAYGSAATSTETTQTTLLVIMVIIIAVTFILVGAIAVRIERVGKKGPHHLFS